MATFQVSDRSNREIRVGRDGQTVAQFKAGWLIADHKGEVEGVAAALKLPAPWRGMRYRLEVDGSEIASAPKPTSSRTELTYELEAAGRVFDLTTRDRHGLLWVLSENGVECGGYKRREFDEDDEWTADVTVPENEPALAAFVAWLTNENHARAYRLRES